MELNEMKSHVNAIKAPGNVRAPRSARQYAMGGLIERIQASDAKDRRTIRMAMTLQIMAAVLCIPLFTLMWIAPPDTTPDRHRFIMGVFIVLYLWLALVFGQQMRKTARIDYAGPVDAFLRETEKRFRLFQPVTWLVVLPAQVILLGNGGLAWETAMERYAPGLGIPTSLIIYGVFMTVVLSISVWYARREWNLRKKPIWCEVKAMLRELESEEPT
jgi:hypothetical protein